MAVPCLIYLDKDWNDPFRYFYNAAITSSRVKDYLKFVSSLSNDYYLYGGGIFTHICGYA